MAERESDSGLYERADARVIAQHLAATGAASLDDSAIERIFEFAPPHDIGKLALPDRILLKRVSGGPRRAGAPQPS